MEQKDWLDQSSIYSQQHHTFYRWVLYPVILFLCLGGFFLVFAKKEIVIRTPAQLTAQKVEKLQVPIEAKIKANNLKENQTVKKGEILVTFDTTSLQNEKTQIEQENTTIEQQKSAAQMFIDSLMSEQNLFETEDDFGYSNQVKSFLAEKEATLYALKQSEVATQKEQETYDKAKEQLEKQLTMRQKEQRELEQVRTAWIDEQSLEGFSPEITSKYQLWKVQLTDTPEEQKKQVKATILATIDELITQKKKEIEQLQVEQAKLVVPSTTENEINSQKEKGKQSKELALATAKEKVIELTGTQKKNDIALKTINEQLTQSTLKAPITGTIHLNAEVENQLEVPKGTTLAEVYPEHKNSELSFTALLPTSESMRVKPGMDIHFKLDKKGVATKTINGTLKEISENSTTTDQGTFYTIKGILNPSNNFTSRYGLTGELSLIIGKKTYWQQIKDTLLNQQ
ncbi:bacteriocin secretion accessory protein [Enterococcus sp. DIV1420a]|uniref:bacteriocin secretion accessory protein n=1 Tax=Enterococcus sp. DIV1420a TaxID=2774672 RepID=UPI003F1F0902